MIAVVLAGGASRRFGTDKLAARLGTGTLLEATLAGLPPDCAVIVVGPARSLARPVRFVREQPPGGGPAAALVTGLRSALDGSSPAAGDLVVVLPGDAPGAGAAAVLLAEELTAEPDRTAVVGVDEQGREQPLQRALRPAAARRLIAAAGPEPAGRSARSLLPSLGGRLLRRPLPRAAYADVDTPADLARLIAQPEELGKPGDA